MIRNWWILFTRANVTSKMSDDNITCKQVRGTMRDVAQGKQYWLLYCIDIFCHVQGPPQQLIQIEIC